MTDEKPITARQCIKAIAEVGLALMPQMVFAEDISGNIGKTVTFMNGNATYAKEVVSDGMLVLEPVEPTQDGYTFTGWYTDEALTQKFEFGRTLSESITLYAGWDELITVNLPFTTTVKQAGNVAPGETTFNLQVLGSDGDKLSSVEVEVEATPVKINGEGEYDGTLKIRGASEDIANMLRDKVFVKQADGNYPDWTVDDAVWGLAWKEGIVAMAADDAVADNSVLIFPAEYVKTEDGGYYEMVEGKDAAEKMSFINIYTKSEGSPAEPDDTTDEDPDNDSNAYAEDSTKTGDDTNIALWLTLMLIAGTGITGTTIYARRKRTNE
ncbi:MAG: InlB B-repeat-containing protein [Firmicutes bacterium]|nr:InlB B-repeat-containing protein [Bacillota bacterium]